MSQTNTKELAQVYVNHVASIEAQQKWPSPHDRLSEASQLFGQLCVDAAERYTLPDLREVDAKLTAIEINRRDFISQNDKISAEKRQAQLFHSSLHWLQNGDVRATQRRMMWKVGLLLDHCLKQLPERPPKFRSALFGEIGELSILGAFNIMDDPNFPAFPAPPHHGNHRNPIYNYDVALIDGRSLRVQKIEVKFGCQGFCNTPIKSPHKEHQRSRYGHDIALMSGHCDTADINNDRYSQDLGMFYDHRDQTGNLNFARLLAETAFRWKSVSSEDFWYLYHVGDTAIENITGTKLHERLGKATSKHTPRSSRIPDRSSSVVRPQAHKKALENPSDYYSSNARRESKGYTNKALRRNKKLKNVRAKDFAYL